jgi:hypothetical protein
MNDLKGVTGMMRSYHRTKKHTVQDVRDDGQRACCGLVGTNIRVRCYNLIYNRRSKIIIYISIFISSLLLALEHPGLDPEVQLWIKRADLLFLGIFMVEAALKITAHTFASTQKAYIYDPWNALDFTLVFTSSISVLVTEIVSTETYNLQFVVSLRLLRVLRPLRAMRVIPGMRVVVQVIPIVVVLIFDVVKMISPHMSLGVSNFS